MRRDRANPWWMLALGLFAQVTGAFFISTPVFLIPYLQESLGLSLAEAGLVAAAPNVGMVATLIVWGALADRIGERWVITAGLAVMSAAALLALLASDTVVLLGLAFVLGGMGSASSNAASGRVVVGWFPAHRRGIAMGIRQMAQPLGVTAAALVIPALSHSAGLPSALAVAVVASVVATVVCAVGIVDPPRPRAAAPGTLKTLNPYRVDRTLLRIHLVSCLLVFPQFVVATFGLVWLISDLGWDPVAAGAVVGLSQLIGALGRIGVGALSDRVRSRMRPLRWVAVSAIGVMLLMSMTGWLAPALAPVMLVIAATVTVADNGLAFTAVAEFAGPAWSGRALGVQNTGQFIVAAMVAPVMGLVIGMVGYPLGFAVTALLPAAAVPLIPKRDQASPWG